MVASATMAWCNLCAVMQRDSCQLRALCKALDLTYAVGAAAVAGSK